MTLKQFENLKIGDLVISRSTNSSVAQPVTNINRLNKKLHIGATGRWRSFTSFDLLTVELVEKYVKRRVSDRESPYFEIITSENQVIFRINKDVKL